MRQPHNVHAARDLRKRLTPAEERLCAALRNRQASGLKFRRQHPVGACVLEFAIPSIRLGIELDRSIHDDMADDDAYRSEVLAHSGYRIVRFPNQRVFDDLDRVIAEILELARG